MRDWIRRPFGNLIFLGGILHRMKEFYYWAFFYTDKTYPSLAALERERSLSKQRVQKQFRSVHAGKGEKRIWNIDEQ